MSGAIWPRMRASMRRQAMLTAVVGPLALGASPSHAARPLTTDDGDIVDPRACEWESFASRQNGGRDGGSAWQTQLACGVSPGLQLATNLSATEGAGNHARVLGLGGKLRLLSREADGLRAAAGLSLNMLRLDGASYQIQDNGVNFILSQAVGAAWTAHVNLGVVHSRKDHVIRGTWNAALERAVGHDVEIGGEVFGDDKDPTPWFGTGLRWTPVGTASSWNASFSVRGGNRAHAASLGYRFSF